MPKWTDEQALAINETGKNIIVSAGAGSGKTAVLSERVLTHIKSGIQIDELLILTFTNAAAAEMKERIRKKLKENDIKEQLDKVDVAYITTFDAYALSLVKKYNHLLNISDNVTIIDSSIINLKKRKILKEIFEEYYDKENSLFLKLIDDFCLKDDKEIFNGIMAINDKLDNLYNKEEYLTNYIQSHYKDDVIKSYINEYLIVIKNKVESLKNTVENLSIYVDYSYIQKINEVLNPILNAKTYTEFKNNCHVKLPPVPRGSDEVAKAIKKEIPEILKNIETFTQYKDENEIKENIIKTKDYVQIIIQIILELENRIKKFKYENDAYEFVDISKLAINILERNKEVRDELKNKYKEILIDEYQDTNDLQDLFISYIENNNVYMVGDVKQSIYIFRNANPLLFKEKYNNYSMNNGGMKIDLNKNFRSRKDVTDNINLIFNLIMDDNIGGAEYLETHQMIYGNTSYENVNKENYQMEVLSYTMPDDKTFSKEEIEIFTIAKDIKEKVEGKFKIMDKDTSEERDITYGDFVILMDRSSSFENYKKIFEYLNIPLTIYRDKSISDSIDIMIIKNIYNLIISISEKKYDTLFKYSFISVARSYLFNIDDESILKTLNNGNFYDTEIYSKCKNLADKLSELSNKELYDEIIYNFNFYEKIVTIGNVNNHIVTLDSIGKIVRNISDFGYGPKKFLDYLNEISKEGLDIKLSLNKQDNNSVKIMTIHSSKGLEYHVCYFSGLYKKFNIDDLKNKFYFDNYYGLITPYVDNAIKNTILKTLLKQKYIYEEISEKLRLFYVALTRAREKIIMVTELKNNPLAYKTNGIIDNETRLKYMSFSDILNSIYDYLINYVKEVDIEKLHLTKDYNLRKTSDYKNLLNYTEPLEVDEYKSHALEIETVRFSKNIHSLQSKEETDNIKLGLEMHKVFENIDFENPDYTGVSDFQKRKVEKFIHSGILKGSVNLYKEYEFMYQSDNKDMHGFIDLLIEYENSYSIVDYKLKNTDDDDYVKQLNGYKNYIESITEKEVEVYLYSIINEKLIKIN